MIARILVALTRLLFGAYPRWQFCKPVPTQRIYFANHSSHLDTVTLWAALPGELRRRTRPVAARDYWQGGLRAMIAGRGLNAVLLERRREHAEGDPLQPVYDALRAGDSLILFPEGTRNDDLLPLPFKSGLYHMAVHFPGVELVAVYLDNARRSLPKGSWLPVPLICTARFGEALSLHDGEDKAKFLERARDAVVRLA